MYWNHRVVRRVTEAGPHYSVEEVYYDDDGHVVGWTEKDSVFGATPQELRDDLTYMMTALDKPTLDEVAMQVEADAARARGDQDIFPNEAVSKEELTAANRVPLSEVLDSLGLERGDVEEFLLPPVAMGEPTESLGFPDEVGPDAGRLPEMPATQPITEEDLQ